MAEWLKAHAWKACLGETLTWVRIPLSPPFPPSDYNGWLDNDGVWMAENIKIPISTIQLGIENTQRTFQSALCQLKSRYIFRNEETVELFLSTYPSAISILLRAAPEIDKSFGRDAIVNLEEVSDDDDAATLYAIVIWRGSPESAEAALEDFDDRWWLNQTPQPGLTFTYELHK